MSGKPTVRSYGHGTESNTLYSTNHSAQNHFSTNQNAWIWHGHGTVPSLHGTNRTVTTSHSYENDSIIIIIVSHLESVNECKEILWIIIINSIFMYVDL